MSKIEVEGMHRLQGEVKVQGSKNAVLPILSACVLNEGETILHGCPKIQDVSSMLELLEAAGAKIKWENKTLIINTAAMQPQPLIEKAGCMRSSIMLLGSFLGRFREAVIGYPGGCCIGKRPIDLHEQVLGAMGAIFCEEEQFLVAKCEQLEGCDLYLPYPSVGVTENILLAAAKASGLTRIFGAAKEPEIETLCEFLIKMGVKITGVGTDKLTVMRGTLHTSIEYEICPDRIVAGTYLYSVVSAGGEVILKNVPLQHMKQTIQMAGKLGAKLHRDGKDMKIMMEQQVRSIPYLRTAPYPGFPTDLQSPLVAALCKADGESRIEERIFENRFLIVEELEKMGARIQIKDRIAHIYPAKELLAAELTAKELRGGAALVLAAQSAIGTSVIRNAEIIDRGYEDLVGDFEKMGARIRRIP